MVNQMNLQKVDIKKRLLIALVVSLVCFVVSALSVKFYEYDAVRYAWLFIVFWLCVVFAPKFFLELIKTKRLNEIFLIPVVIVVFFSAYFDIGEKMMILGFGVGITYTIVLVFSSYYPVLFNRSKK